MTDSPRVLALLARLGRASTPAVPNGPPGMSISSLTGLRVDDQSLFVVATEALRDRLAACARVTELLPGKTDCVSEQGQPVLIVEQAALYEGAWLGTGDYVSSALVEELYQAQATVRRRGGIALWIDSGHAKGMAETRLLSASSGAFQEFDVDDPELDDGRSNWWMAIREHLQQKDGSPHGFTSSH